MIFLIGSENGEVKNPNENPSYNSDMVEIWFQASIDEFKASFATEPDSVMKIGSGEVVTVCCADTIIKSPYV